jgi:uncharacterized membrane-anchored protein YjiN (DUF445 family)
VSATEQTLPTKAEDYVRMRALATGLLLFMALLFVVALFQQETHPMFAWLRAFAEAAMVGALADWYAVTALFRHPLGLPIPHTAIISGNTERIASNIGSLTQRKLVTPEGIARLVGSWRIPEELIEALLAPERRRALTYECAQILVRALNASEDATMQRMLRDIATKVMRGVSVAPLAGQMLAGFLGSHQRDRLLNDILSAVLGYVDANRDSLGRTVAEKLPWSRVLSFVKLDYPVSHKVLDSVYDTLCTMRDDPHDPMRRKAIERLHELSKWLMHSGEALRREASLKEKLLAYDTLLQFLDDSWHRLKQWMLDDLSRDPSDIRAYLDAALADIGRTLQKDAALRAMLHDGVQGLVEALATRHSDKIGELVANTVREWSPAQMVETIEREVGKDLQYIRINGTIVGGLVGLLLHALALLIGGR